MARPAPPLPARCISSSRVRREPTKANSAATKKALASTRASTAASRIATACPFCYIMIDDGVKGEGVDEEQVKVADIAMHVLEAVERGEAAVDARLGVTTGAEALQE